MNNREQRWSKLILGSGTYNTCSGILLPSLNGYFGTLSIQGASQEQTIISQSCAITNAVIYHADAINGDLGRLLLRDFRVNANQNAPSCMDIFGASTSRRSRTSIARERMAPITS